MMKILIVDDHAVVRDGVKRIFDEQRDEAVFGEASTAQEALKLVYQGTWDVVVLDISLGWKERAGCLARSETASPQASRADSQYALRRSSMRAGLSAPARRGISPKTARVRS